MAAVSNLSDKVEGILSSDNEKFVLDVNDLIQLAQYVHVGLGLPQTSESFREKYPWEKIQRFFYKDPGLYDGIAGQLPTNYAECSKYEKEIEPAIDKLGDDIIELATDAGKGMADVHQHLGFVAEDGSHLKDPSVKEAVGKIVDILGSLVTRLEANKALSAEVVTKLSQFQTDTNNSHRIIGDLSGRWNTCVPDDDQIARDHQQAVEAAERVKEAAMRAVGEAEAKKDRVEDRQYYRWGLMFCGPIGVVLLATDLLTGPTLDELRTSAENAQKDYVNAIQKWSDEGKTWSLAQSLLINVHDNMTNVSGSIDNTLSALKDLMTAFSKITTNFKNLLNAVQDIEDDINEDDVRDRLIAFDDLKRAEAVWAKINEVASKFREYNKLDQTLNHNVGPNSSYKQTFAGTQKDRLGIQESLYVDQFLVSANGLYKFIMQGDSNLVLYGPSGALWASDTWNTSARNVIMQPDGNLVIYDANDRPLWASNTDGNWGRNEFVVQNDGNACVYTDDRCVWASNTWQG